MSSSDTLSESDAVLLEIDSVCTQFEAEWSSQTATSLAVIAVERFRPDHAKGQLLRELVAIDCELRTNAELDPDPGQFAELFPQFKSDIERAVELWKQTEFAREKSISLLETPPERIGDYRIIREIGRGGTSVVYEAIQPDLDRRVALKARLLHPLRFTEQRQRFELEVKTASRLEHENIVAVYDSGEDSGVLFYAMQFVDGVSLHELIRGMRRRDIHSADAGQEHASAPRSSETDAPAPDACNLTRSEGNGTEQFKTPSPKRSAQLIAQAALALEFAHQRGVLHRDVKPSNLMLDHSGTIRLSDFGLARLTDSDSDLTQTGNIVGSLRYLPPEVFDGLRDERGDVYGLGLTLYELLTRQPAFGTKDRAELIRSICEFEVQSSRQIDPLIPADLDTITMKAIARDPADRYQSAREMSDDLERFLAGQPIRARRVSFPERAWKWILRHRALATLSLVAAAFVMLGIPAFLLMWQGRELDRVNAAAELAEAALREERVTNQVRVASAMADQQRARAAGAAEARDEAQYALLVNSLQQSIKAEDYADAQDRMRSYDKKIESAVAAGLPVIDRRDWEWDYLRHRWNESETEIQAAESEITSLKLSPSEEKFITVDVSPRNSERTITHGRLQVWDADRATVLRTLGGSEEVITNAAFSPDGSQIATISLRDSSSGRIGRVALWDANSGQRLESRELVDDYPLKRNTSQIKQVLPQIQFSSDGGILVTTSPVIAFDSKTLQPIWKQPGYRALALANGKVAIHDGSKLALHDLLTGTPIPKASRKCALVLDLTPLSSSSAEFSSIGIHGTPFTVWRIKDDSIENESFRCSKSFWSVATPDGNRYVRSDVGGNLYVHELREDSEVVSMLVGHRGPVVRGTFNRDGTRLFTADQFGVVMVWDLAAASNPLKANIHDVRQGTVEALSFGPDGDRIHYASSRFHENSKDLPKSGWISSDGTEQDAFNLDTTNYISWPRSDLAYSRDGSLLAAPAREFERPANDRELVGDSNSGRVHIWETASHQIIRTIEIGERRVSALAWSWDKSQLAIATVSDQDVAETDASIGVVSLNSGDSDPTWIPFGSSHVQALCFVPDGSQLAVGAIDGGMSLVPLENDIVPGSRSDSKQISKDSGPIVSIDVDRGGQKLAIACFQEGVVRVYDIQTLDLHYEIDAPDGVCCVRFSPNGRRLALVGQQSIGYLCDAQSGHRLLTLDGRSEVRHPSPGVTVQAVFSPDGHQIAINSLAGRITVWDSKATDE